MSETMMPDTATIDDRWGAREPDPIDVPEAQDTTAHERGLLSAVMRLGSIPDAALEQLEGRHFYRPECGTVWDVLCDMTRRGQTLDIVVVLDEVRRQMPHAVTRLHQVIVAGDWLESSTITHYVTQIRVGHQVRTMQAQLLRAHQFLSQGLIHKAQEAMAVGADVTAVDRYGWTLEEVFAELEAEASQPPRFVETPWKKLNADLHGGLLPGQLYVVCGAPGTGKTIVGQMVTAHAATTGSGAIIFSLEMQRIALLRRLLATAANVPMAEVMRHDFMLTKESWERVNDFRQTVIEFEDNVIINDEVGLTIEQINSKARIAKRRHQIGVVVIDYTQLVNAVNHGRTEVEQIRHVARSMAEMAKDLDIPVLALAQPNRNAAFRESGRLQVSDLHGSSEMEKAAAAILLLNQIKEEDQPVEVVEFDLAKNRYGKVSTHRMLFDGSRQSFVEL